MTRFHRIPSWQRILLGSVAIILVLAFCFFNFRSEELKKPTGHSPLAQDAKPGRLPSIPTTMKHAVDPQVKAVIERFDASKDDGWDTEVLADIAKKKLAHLAQQLIDPSSISPASLADVCDLGVTSSPLRPSNLREIYTDGSISVFRPAVSFNDSEQRPSYAGIERVCSKVQEIFETPNCAKIRAKFKVVGVESVRESFHTTVDVQFSGLSAEGRTQINATWHCRWKSNDDPKSVKLMSIDSTQFEQIVAKADAGVHFSDKTNAILGETSSFQEQLTRGADFWCSRLDVDFGVDVNGNQGIAVGDVNGDGLDDLYVCQPGGLPNRLYVRTADGKMLDNSASAGVDFLDLTRSALLLDLDNDADQDLVVCQGWYLLFMLNSGDGHFQLSQQHRCRGGSYSLTSADFDNDGDLDIFVCGRDPDPTDAEFIGVLGSPMPYHDANNGAPNMLLENDGKARFRDVTVEVGLDQNNRRFSYAAAWADYDQDGDMDLYVANDFGRNNLYQNTGGRFSDVADELGVEDISAGMSVTWGDYNNDNLFDVYVSNMYSSAGNRIAYQRRFREGMSKESLTDFQRHARGNTLFQNNKSRTSEHLFQDVSHESGVTMGRWAWGAKFVDVNNDSREDIYVANGFITTEDSGDL